MMEKLLAVICHLCGSDQVLWVADVSRRPARENDFKIPENQYKRSVYHCQNCDVFFNQHNFMANDFYQGTYNAAVYGTRLKEKYQEIMALAYERSDNRQRVQRIHSLLQKQHSLPATTKVLDVGAGLCVFLGAMKEIGYRVYALDPDPVVIRHAENHVRVEKGFISDVKNFETNLKFELITLNKVLEHVQNPIQVLQRVTQWLADKGLIYIELPDGEAARQKEVLENREEFFIEHVTIFTPKSMNYLIHQCGLRAVTQEAAHEPSDKYTLYGFYQKGHHG